MYLRGCEHVGWGRVAWKCNPEVKCAGLPHIKQFPYSITFFSKEYVLASNLAKYDIFFLTKCWKGALAFLCMYVFVQKARPVFEEFCVSYMHEVCGKIYAT